MRNECKLENFSHELNGAFKNPMTYDAIHTELHWSDKGWFTNFNHMANGVFHLFYCWTPKDKFPIEAMECLDLPCLAYRYVWFLFTDDDKIEVIQRGRTWHKSEDEAMRDGNQNVPSIDISGNEGTALSMETVCECQLQDNPSKHCTCEIMDCDLIYTDLSLNKSSTCDDIDKYVLKGHTVCRAPLKVEIAPNEKHYMFHVEGGDWYVSSVKNVEKSFKLELMKRL